MDLFLCYFSNYGRCAGSVEVGFHCFQRFGEDLKVVPLSTLFIKSLSRHPPKDLDFKFSIQEYILPWVNERWEVEMGILDGTKQHFGTQVGVTTVDNCIGGFLYGCDAGCCRCLGMYMVFLWGRTGVSVGAKPASIQLLILTKDCILVEGCFIPDADAGSSRVSPMNQSSNNLLSGET